MPCLASPGSRIRYSLYVPISFDSCECNPNPVNQADVILEHLVNIFLTVWNNSGCFEYTSSAYPILGPTGERPGF
jgi:hypothetical protein